MAKKLQKEGKSLSKRVELNKPNKDKLILQK